MAELSEEGYKGVDDQIREWIKNYDSYTDVINALVKRGNEIVLSELPSDKFIQHGYLLSSLIKCIKSGNQKAQARMDNLLKEEFYKASAYTISHVCVSIMEQNDYEYGLTNMKIGKEILGENFGNDVVIKLAVTYNNKHCQKIIDDTLKMDPGEIAKKVVNGIKTNNRDPRIKFLNQLEDAGYPGARELIQKVNDTLNVNKWDYPEPD